MFSKNVRICKIEDCNEKHLGKGLCQKHYDEQYSQDNKEKRAKQHEQWYKDNKKWLTKHKKQYYLNNKEYFTKQNRQYAQEHKKEKTEYMEQFYLNNREKILEYAKQYIKTPSGKASMKVHYHNRRTLLKGLTIATIQRVYEDNIKKYGTLTCILCFKPIEFGDDSLEHKTPLSRQGTNNYENLGVSHKHCNSKKHTMTLGEWFGRSI